MTKKVKRSTSAIKKNLMRLFGFTVFRIAGKCTRLHQNLWAESSNLQGAFVAGRTLLAVSRQNRDEQLNFYISSAIYSFSFLDDA